MSKKTTTTTTEAPVVEAPKFDPSAYPTKSAAIRALYASGTKKGEIAKLLNIRYQHVRNVLITPVKQPKV